MTTAGSEGFLTLIPIYLDHILYPTLTVSSLIFIYNSLSRPRIPICFEKVISVSTLMNSLGALRKSNFLTDDEQFTNSFFNGNVHKIPGDL